PCVASLLTGTYSFVHGIRSIFGLKLNPSVSSLVEILRHHGYQTYAEVSGPLFLKPAWTGGSIPTAFVKGQRTSPPPGEQTCGSGCNVQHSHHPGFFYSTCGSCTTTATFCLSSAAGPMVATATSVPSPALTRSWPHSWPRFRLTH